MTILKSFYVPPTTHRDEKFSQTHKLIFTTAIPCSVSTEHLLKSTLLRASHFKTLIWTLSFAI